MTDYMKKYISIQILFIALATAISGELRIAPFGWEFRFGLGSSIFFLLLLLMNHVPMIRTGIFTGIVVVVFRTLTSSTFTVNPTMFFDVLLTHIPAMFYYIAFALGLSLIPKELFKSRLLLLGVVVVLVDFGSNIVEIWCRKLLTITTPLLWSEWLTLLVVAIVRVFFIIGLYANFILKQLQVLHLEQQKRFEQMLKVGSSLYSESFYMKKMLESIEDLTLSSYELYRRLLQNQLQEYSKHALTIAEGVHEIKKDAQRIRAGLQKLNKQTETKVDMSLAEILDFVIKANLQYSEWFGKNLSIEHSLKVNYVTSQHLPLLIVLNNLVANAIEATEDTGIIHISLYEDIDSTIFIVQDVGNGIKKQDLPYIFEPGYTTKYNQEGIAATGIGLSHVKNIIELFDGEIDVFSSEGEGTKFVMKLSTVKLKFRE